MEMSDIHKELLYICSIDDLSFGELVRSVSRDAYYMEYLPAWAKRKVMEVIRYLLQNGLVVVGKLGHKKNDPDFIELFSPEEVDKAVAYIEKKWNKHGQAPSHRDLCWFNLTVKGEDSIREITEFSEEKSRILSVDSENKIIELFDLLFQEKIKGTFSDYHHPSYKIPGWGEIGFRTSSKHKLTIDINIPGIPIDRIYLPK